MSQQTQAILPNPQDAYNTLMSDAYQRVFFSKVAAAGYGPQTAEDAEYLLTIAGQARAISQQQAVKEAQANDHPLAAVTGALDNIMVGMGMPGHLRQAEQTEKTSAERHVAASLARDPGLYNSVLALKADQAQQLLQQARQGG